MVDTPKEGNGVGTAEDDPSKKQPKRRRQRRRSKSRRTKDNNTGTGENNTPDDAENNEDLVEVTPEQEEQENGQASPDEQVRPNDSEDGSYRPLSEDEESLGNEDFIVPEEPLEQERFKRRLIATTRSLRKKQLQLQASQDFLNGRWTKVLATEEYGLSSLHKSHPKGRWLPQYDGRALEPTPPSNNAAGRPQFGPGMKIDVQITEIHPDRL